MAERARPGPAPATTAKWMSAGLCSIPETVSTGAPPAAPATPAKIATPETPEIVMTEWATGSNSAPGNSSAPGNIPASAVTAMTAAVTAVGHRAQSTPAVMATLYY